MGFFLNNDYAIILFYFYLEGDNMVLLLLLFSDWFDNITLYFVESRRCTGDGGRIGAWCRIDIGILYTISSYTLYNVDFFASVLHTTFIMPYWKIL